MLRYGCPCLNITLHLGSEVGIEEPTEWMKEVPDTPQWKKCMMGLGGTRTRIDVLMSNRTLTHGWQMWTLYRCDNCNTYTHVIPVGTAASSLNSSASAPAPAALLAKEPPPSPSRPASRGFFSALSATFFDTLSTPAPAAPTPAPASTPAMQTIFINAALQLIPEQPTVLSGYSPVFGLVILPPPSSPSSPLPSSDPASTSSTQANEDHTPDPSDTEGTAQFTAQTKLVQDFLAAETLAMKERLLAFEREEQARFVAVQAKAYQDRKLLWQKIKQVREARQPTTPKSSTTSQSQNTVHLASKPVMTAPPPPSSSMPDLTDPSLLDETESMDVATPNITTPQTPTPVSQSVSSSAASLFSSLLPSRMRAPSPPAPPPPTSQTVPSPPLATSTAEPLSSSISSTPPTISLTSSNLSTTPLTNTPAKPIEVRKRTQSFDATDGFAPSSVFDFDDLAGDDDSADETPLAEELELIDDSDSNDDADDDDDGGDDEQESKGSNYDDRGTRSGTPNQQQPAPRVVVIAERPVMAGGAAAMIRPTAIANNVTTPQFQACSLPIQIPERFANWKPRAQPARKSKPTSSATPAQHPLPSASSSSSDANTSESTIDTTAAAESTSSQTTTATTDARAPQQPLPLSSEDTDGGIAAAESDSEDDQFVIPHQLIIEQENADELSRSFAVPLSLTRMRPGFL